jgi:hypothetical protein
LLYQVHQLKDRGRPGSARLIQLINGELEKTLSVEGSSLYGIFVPLFGLASNEIYLVSYAQKPTTLDLPPEIQELSCRDLIPTVRPTEDEPRSRPGIYVFRWFSVAADSVDEIVRLSSEAWPTFEASFETEVQGLFVDQGDSPGGMLLITWYKDLSVWEESRQPPEKARDNFLRRHQLTLSALPIATMLAGEASGTSRLISHS